MVCLDFDNFNFNERKHDMSDAMLMVLYFLSCLNKPEKVQETETGLKPVFKPVFLEPVLLEPVFLEPVFSKNRFEPVLRTGLPTLVLSYLCMDQIYSNKFFCW